MIRLLENFRIRGGDRVFGKGFGMKKKVGGLLCLLFLLFLPTVLFPMTVSADVFTESIKIKWTDSTTLNVGVNRQLRAYEILSDGTSRYIDNYLCTWTSSDPSVAKFGMLGDFTTVGGGTATITVKYGAYTDSLTITVNEEIQSINVNPGSITLDQNLTANFQVNRVMASGTSRDVTGDCTYSLSGDPNLVTVSGGKVTPTGAIGWAVMTVTYEGKSVNVPVTVISHDFIDITANPSSIAVEPGKTKQLMMKCDFELSPPPNQTVSFRDETETGNCRYSSNNPAIATVSSKGLVTGVAEGSTTITVAYPNKTVTVPVNVSSVTLLSITSSPVSLNYTPYCMKLLTVMANMSDGTSKNVSNECSFTSKDSSIATVSYEYGFGYNLYGHRVGSTTVTASYMGYNVDIPVTITTSVVSISSSVDTVYLEKGQSHQLQIIGKKSDGSTVDVAGACTFEPNANAYANIAEVDYSKGYIKGLKAGYMDIKVIYQNYVIIVPVEVSELQLNTSKLELNGMELSKQIKLIHIKLDHTTENVSDLTTEDIKTADCTFTSGDSNIATVNASGLVSAVSLGSTTITVKYQSFTFESTVKVSDNIGLEGMPGSVSIKYGDKSSIAIRKFTGLSMSSIVTTDSTLTSDDPSIATVSPEGLITSVAPGSTTIRAKYYWKTTSIPVTVSSYISPSVSFFNLDTGSSEYADIPVTMFCEKNTLLNIKNGSAILNKDTDYTVSGGTVTLLKEYLSKQPLGTTTLTFVFAAGNSSNITITVRNMAAQNSSVSSAAVIFDKNPNGGDYYLDVPVTIAFNGNLLTDIKNGSTALVEGKDYTVQDNVATIRKEYLTAQNGNIITLTFYFNGGSTVNYASLSISCMDTRSFSNVKDIYIDAHGNRYIVDQGSYRIFMVAAKDAIRLGKNIEAGKTYIIASNVGFEAAVALNISINDIYNIAVDPSGNLYLKGTGEIFEVPAENGIQWGINMEKGKCYSIVATSNTDYNNFGMAVDLDGNLYYPYRQVICVKAAKDGIRFGIDIKAGNTYTIAGTGVYGDIKNGVPATSSSYKLCKSICIDSSGNLYYADSEQKNVVEIANKDGIQRGISMEAGYAYLTAGSGSLGDGSAATSAEVGYPLDVTTDASGNIFIADLHTRSIREVAASDGIQYGIVMKTGYIYTVVDSVYAGNNSTSAAVDASGTIYTSYNKSYSLLPTSSAACLTSVLGQDNIIGSSSQTSVSLTVEYYVESVSASDFAANSGATVTFYGTDSFFTIPESGSVPLSAGTVADGGTTTVYVSVKSPDELRTVFYTVTICRKLIHPISTVLGQPIVVTGQITYCGWTTYIASIHVPYSVDKVTVDDVVGFIPWSDKFEIFFTYTEGTNICNGDGALIGSELAAGADTVIDLATVAWAENMGSSTDIDYEITVHRDGPIAVGSQNGRLTAGATGSATFAATASEGASVSDGAVTADWCDASGTAALQPTGLSAEASNMTSGSSIVTVSADTTADAGTYYFKVTSGTYTSGVTAVTVSAPIAVTGVTLDKDTLSLTAEESGQLAATVAPDNATNKNVTWSSDKPEVATVDSNGKVTAVAVGTATVTVTTEDGSKAATCTVTVAPVAVTGVTLDKDTLSLTAGESGQLAATVAPDNATNKNVTWSSDKPEVATVDSNGKVTAVAVGTATVTVTTEDGSKAATCTVTVAPVTITGVTLDNSTLSLTAGESGQLTATVAPDNATNKNVTWSSDKPEVATVDSNGKVTAVAVGTATVTVTTEDGSKAATCTVTVAPVAVTGVTLDNSTLSLTAGESGQLTATVAPDNATNKNVTWSSDSEGVATVDSNGKVTAVAVGTATVTVTTEDGSKTDTCAVTVTAATVAVTDVTLDKDTLSLTEGTGGQLTATVAPDNATNKNVTWSSDSEGVATVDSNGKVTAVAVGTATVTVTTEDGSKTDTCAVTVTAATVAVTDVTLDKDTLSLTEGTGGQLTATVAPDNATNKNVTWSSDSEGVATVDNNGKVTAVAEGTATITVTTEDGSKTDTCTVAVTKATVPVTDAEKMVADKAALTWDVIKGANTLQDSVTSDLNLPETGIVYGSAITWESDDTSVIGESGEVIRPAFSSGDADVTVTASVYCNGVSDTKDFSLKVLKLAQPTYTVTFRDWDGTVLKTQAVNEGSGATAPDNPGRTGYTFTGWDKAFDNITSDLTVTAQYSRNVSDDGGESGDSEGGKGSNGNGASAETVKTYQAVVSGTGTTAATLSVNVNTNAGSAVVEVGTQQGNTATVGGTEVITIPSIPNVTYYTIGIPVPYLSTTDKSGTLTINSDAGNITIPTNMLTGTGGEEGQKAQITIGQGDKSSLSAAVRADIGDRPLVQLAVAIDGKQTEWNNPETPVTISIPYEPTEAELKNPESIIVWYIDGSGKAVSVPNGHYDPAAGMVTFNTTHFSCYGVGYNKVSFSDVAESAWYNKAVGFIAARNITSGIGSGNYSPEAKLTRGEFMVMLMKAYDIVPDANSKDNFADAGDTYYTGYLAAAKRLGISGGVGDNKFVPDKEVTRQEMFTLLYNALKATGKLPSGTAGKELSSFGDAGQVASWAKDAMTLLVESGTISGNGGKLYAAGTTTRAEMAQVLYNLLSE